MNQYQDINIRTYNFSLKVLKFIDTIDIKRIHYSIVDQVIRSSCSIGANIAEGKSSTTKKEFSRYLEIALKSANETKYWLRLLKDFKNINNQEIDFLLNEADEISRIIAKSVLTIKSNAVK